MRYAVSIAGRTPAESDAIAARIGALERMPAFLRRAVEGRSDAALRARPSPEPDAFSLHEQVWHLRDVELLGYSKRARAIAHEELPFLPDLDGTRLAVERRYLELPLAAALSDFECGRAANVALLRTFPLEAFARRGELEGVGCISLGELLERWCDHDAVHRSEIETFRGL